MGGWSLDGGQELGWRVGVTMEEKVKVEEKFRVEGWRLDRIRMKEKCQDGGLESG